MPLGRELSPHLLRCSLGTGHCRAQSPDRTSMTVAGNFLKLRCLHVTEGLSGRSRKPDGLMGCKWKLIKTVGCVRAPFQKHRCYAPQMTAPQSETFHMIGVGHPTEQPVVSTKPAAYPHLPTQPLNSGAQQWGEGETPQEKNCLEP